MSPVSPQLLSRLLREHGPALVLYAGQWCRTPEDVVQEAFLRLVEQAEPPQNLVAWLHRVVRNGAMNAARAAARRGRHESAAAEWTRPRFDSSNGQLLDARQAADALEHLPDTQRETVIARLWGGLSFDEVARLTGTSTSTAYRRYQAGIRALRERLGDLCPRNENPREM